MQVSAGESSGGGGASSTGDRVLEGGWWKQNITKSVMEVRQAISESARTAGVSSVGVPSVGVSSFGVSSVGVSSVGVSSIGASSPGVSSTGVVTVESGGDVADGTDDVPSTGATVDVCQVSGNHQSTTVNCRQVRLKGGTSIPQVSW
jgi:hypothetical protein